MRKLFLTLAIFALSLPSQAERYLGCGGGVSHQSLAANNWLVKNYIDMGYGHCWFENTPALSQDGLILTLPSVHYQRGRASSWSQQTDGDTNKFEQLDVRWPLLRHGLTILGLKAGNKTLNQTQNLSQDLQYQASNNLLAAQRPWQVQEKNSYIGAYFDTSMLGTLISEVSLSHYHYQQPILAYHPAQNILSDARLKAWQLSLVHKPKPLGVSFYWQFAAERGKTTELSYPDISSIEADQYIGTNLLLGLSAKYRYSTHIHPYFDLRAKANYWYFSDERDYVLSNLYRLDYAASVGLSWRFR